jgi:hypothetical protein
MFAPELNPLRKALPEETTECNRGAAYCKVLRLADAEFVGSFKRCAAAAADHGRTIAARKGIGDFNGALWTVENVLSV